MMYNEWMHYGWPFGGLVWLALLALAVYGFWLFLRSREPSDAGRTSASAGALGTLDERYAKSEIDREEYLRRKRDILGKGEA